MNLNSLGSLHSFQGLKTRRVIQKCKLRFNEMLQTTIHIPLQMEVTRRTDNHDFPGRRFGLSSNKLAKIVKQAHQM